MRSQLWLTNLHSRCTLLTFLMGKGTIHSLSPRGKKVEGKSLPVPHLIAALVSSAAILAGSLILCFMTVFLPCQLGLVKCNSDLRLTQWDPSVQHGHQSVQGQLLYVFLLKMTCIKFCCFSECLHNSGPLECALPVPESNKKEAKGGKLLETCTVTSTKQRHLKPKVTVSTCGNLKLCFAVVGLVDVDVEQ